MTPTEAIKRLEILLQQERDSYGIYATGAVKNVEALKIAIKALRGMTTAGGKSAMASISENA